VRSGRNEKLTLGRIGHKHPHHDGADFLSIGMVLMDERTPPRKPRRKGLDEAVVEGFK
jgi:hypothetical protein